MKTAGIIGLGLLGGSVAKALRQKCGFEKIVAYNRTQSNLDQALSEKIIDAGTNKIDENFADCDIVFVCSTVDLIAAHLAEVSKFIKNNCILTDVGSTKKDIVKNFSHKNFIAGHPMAGTEKNGYSASFAGLFEGAVWVLTPTEESDPAYLGELEALIKKMGAVPAVIDYRLHDDLVAVVSHMPHIVAYSLVHLLVTKTLENQELNALYNNFFGGGFKDTTRIASSLPSLWTSIIMNNRENLIKLIGEYQKEMESLSDILGRADSEALTAYFEESKKYRDNVYEHKKETL